MKAKSAELAELKSKHDSLQSQLTTQLEREARVFDEDLYLEYSIHKMKGRLYSILAFVDDKCSTTASDSPSGYKLTNGNLELRASAKANSWYKAKFDCVVSSQLDLRENFSYPGYLYDLTFLLLKEEETSREEPVFVVLSAHNRLAQVEAYLAQLLSRSGELIGTSTQAAEFTVRILQGGATVRSLGPMHAADVETTLAESVKQVKELMQAAPVILRLRIAQGTRTLQLAFVFVNAEDPAGLEETKRAARTAKEQTAGRKSQIKEGEEFHQLLGGVKVGYLVVVLDDVCHPDMRPDEVAYLYNVLQTAQIIEESVPAARSEVPARAIR